MDVLWLTKQSLTKTSSQECKSWGFTMFPVLGTSPQKCGTFDLLASFDQPLHITTNYESVNNKDFFNRLRSRKWGVIVIDEVHKLKGGANSTPTTVWRNTADLLIEQVTVHGCFPIFMTGSIVNNKLEEIWAYLHPLDPERFPSLRHFQRTFGRKNWVTGVLEIDQDRLLGLLAPNMIRRGKDEVGEQLPPKNYMPDEWITLDPKDEITELYMDLQRKAFIGVKKDLDSMDDDATLSIGNVIQRIHYLRTALVAPGTFRFNEYSIDDETGERSVSFIERKMTFKPPYPKLDAVFEKVCELRDQGENVIVYSAQYNRPLEYLYDLFTACGHSCDKIVGGSDTSAVQRRFQQNETQILLINMRTGAEGLNLHRCDRWPGGASHVVFIDSWWNPESERQAEDRTWRIGTNRPVFIHRVHVEGTIDELMIAIKNHKKKIASGIADAEELRVGDWKDLLKKFI